MSAEDIYKRLLDLTRTSGWRRSTGCSRSSRRPDSSRDIISKAGTAVFELNEGVHHDHIVCS